MLPRNKHGVVDSKLKVCIFPESCKYCFCTSSKVYGTTNLRIADLSVVPVHIATHTQGAYTGFILRVQLPKLLVAATAYVIGEKGTVNLRSNSTSTNNFIYTSRRFYYWQISNLKHINILVRQPIGLIRSNQMLSYFLWSLPPHGCAERWVDQEISQTLVWHSMYVKPMWYECVYVRNTLYLMGEVYSEMPNSVCTQLVVQSRIIRYTYGNFPLRRISLLLAPIPKWMVPSGLRHP